MKRILRLTVVAGVCLVLPNCALEFGATPTPENCTSDSDCSQFEFCSPVTESCALQAPGPREGWLAGAFECITPNVGFRISQLSGVAMTMQWPEFTDEGPEFLGLCCEDDSACDVAAGQYCQNSVCAKTTNYLVPAETVTLSHRCLVTNLTTSSGGRQLKFSFDGARYYNPNYRLFGFYRIAMYLDAADVHTGRYSVTPVAGYVNFCPADPPELAWANSNYLTCWTVASLDASEILFEIADQNEGGNLVGYLESPLLKNAYPPLPTVCQPEEGTGGEGGGGGEGGVGGVGGEGAEGGGEPGEPSARNSEAWRGQGRTFAQLPGRGGAQ